MQLDVERSPPARVSNPDYILCFMEMTQLKHYAYKFLQVTFGPILILVKSHTDRKWSIRAHHAYAQVGSKTEPLTCICMYFMSVKNQGVLLEGWCPYCRIYGSNISLRPTHLPLADL